MAARIPVSGPSITEREVRYVADAAQNAWYANHNMYHARFEKTFADHLGVPFTMALPSCTSAIHLSLLALGIGPGDEVIVPDVTWIASAAPVSYVGATPVFADIDEATWCLSPESFQQCITPRTRAVIPVDLYGGTPDWDPILATAQRHGIAVIEDAAEAVGSRYRDRPAGSLGRVGVFSFHGSKTLTTGEGGLLATSDPSLFKRAQTLRDHGRPPGDRLFMNTEVAHKYKMSSLQAALGLAQIERLEELVKRKREIFSWYADRLGRLPGLSLNPQPVWLFSSYWMVTLLLDRRLNIDKIGLMEALDRDGIDSRPFFFPLSSLKAYEGAKDVARAREANVVSYRISPRGINLPSGLSLTESDVDRVCASVARIVKAAAG
jgi:perosamine synthetase